MKNNFIKNKPCKKIVTFGPKTKEANGWLLEVISDTDGFTKHLNGQVYLTVANPGEFKGYHLHAVADYFVTCLKGKVREIVYKNRSEKEEIEMGDEDFKTVFVPKGCPHGIKNTGNEPAYVLIYRYPAWSLELKEQLDISPENIETSEAWKIIEEFKDKFK